MRNLGWLLLMLGALVWAGCPADGDDDDDSAAGDDDTGDDDTGDDDTGDDDTGDDDGGDDDTGDDDTGDDDTAEVDGDGDGYTPAEGDCDDTDDQIHPDATEVQDTVDNDCDGMADEGFVAAGDLVITEVFPNPDGSDAVAEWFEVLNTTAATISMEGWVLADQGSDSDQLVGPVLIGAGSYGVVAASVDPQLNGGVTAAGAWGAGFDLADVADEIVLRLDGVEIDAVAYDFGGDYGDYLGVSNNLDSDELDATANDDPDHWCPTPTGTFGGGLGTPGALNEVCPPPPDADGDGYAVADGDCDDNDATVYPGAWELADGVDNDCNGKVDDLGDDLDGDGYGTNSGDCDDGDFTIHPGAAEVRDAVDQDCDGIADEGTVQAGELVITEIFKDAPKNDEDLEWFEVHNTSADPIDLRGWALSDLGTDHHTVTSPAPLLVQPGAFFVFGMNGDPKLNGGVAVDYAYGGDLPLGDADDEIVLSLVGAEIDAVAYDNGITFPDPIGASMNLDPGAYDHVGNDNGAAWCATAVATFPGGLGTPGAENEGC